MRVPARKKREAPPPPPRAARPGRSVVVLVLLVGVLSALVATQWSELRGGFRAPAVARQQQSGRWSVEDGLQALPASAAEAQAVLDARFRVRPDRRLVRAFDELDRMAGRPSAASTMARFEGGHWVLERQRQTLATLPETPSFRDALAALVRYAQGRCPLRPGAPPPELATVVERALSGEGGSTLLHALTAVNDASGPSSNAVGTWTLAAHLLAALAFETHDTLGVGDLVPARALAVLAALRAAGAPQSRDEALLAVALDYTRDAHTLAAELGPHDAVRAFCTRDDARLEALAQGHRQATLLHARRLQDREDPRLAEVVRLLRNRGGEDLATLRLERDLTRTFSQTRAWVPTVPERTLLALERAVGLRDPAPVTSDVLFERLARWVEHAPALGPWWDRDLADAYGHAALLSTVEDVLTFLLRNLAAPREARGYLASLGAHPAETEFYRWAAHRVAAALDEPVLDELLSDLRDLRGLGPSAHRKTFSALYDAAPWGDGRSLTGVGWYARAVDSRPLARAELAGAVQNQGLDLLRAERLLASVVEHAPGAFPGTESRLLALRGDLSALEAIARDRTRSLDARLDAVAEMEAQAPDVDARREATLRSLLAEHLEATRAAVVATTLATLLLARHRDADVEPLFAQGERPPAAPMDLPEAYARGLRARAQSRLGHPDAAWAIVAPALPTWHYIALLEGARAQVGVGRLDQGEALARACAQRYGRPEAVALHAQILWRLGDPAGAAAALQAGALGLLGWRDEVADAFVEVFRDPSRQAPSRMAFDAIVRAGATPEALVSFLEGVTKAGPPTLALDLWVRVPAYGGLVEALERTVQQFLLRRRIEGVNAAEDWLREAVEPARRAPLSVVLFEHGEHALLWSHAEAPDDRFGDNVWLLRAAAALRTTLSTADAQALTAHYRTAGHGVYHTLGEHLSGLEVFPRLRAEAEDPTTAGEAAYWIGYRAQAEGRYAEASDWYQVAILVGNARKHEWRWAFDELQGWSTRNRTLARLQQERFWIRAPPSEAP